VRILGCPLKISRYKYIYFPRLYLVRFGIDIQNAEAIRENNDDYLIFRPFSDRPLAANEEIALIRAGSTYIPSSFLNRNQLTPWIDELYLVGLDDGLKISVKKQVL